MGKAIGRGAGITITKRLDRAEVWRTDSVMAAITPVMKLRVVGLQPAGGGRGEVVDFEEQTSNVATASNLHVMPKSDSVQLTKMTRVVIDKAVAQGSFIKNRNYRVEFTLLADDGTDAP